MKNSPLLPIAATGLAMFAMFFGAGNVIFPLQVGYEVKEMAPFASIGLFLGAVFLPFFGLFSMILCDGDVKRYFDKLGKPFGFIIGFFIISLLGPFGAAPRCIAFASSTLNASGMEISIIPFSLISASLVFALAYRKNRIIGLLGGVLTPILVAILAYMVVSACLTENSLPSSEYKAAESFYKGLKEGYLTMDLLAALFFAPVILSNLRQLKNSPYSLISRALISSLIGASFLALTYLGFCYAAAFNANSLAPSQKEDLLSAIAFKVLGEKSGLLVLVLVLLACLTTVIALLSVFADFVEKTFPKKWNLSYEKVLFLGTFLTAFMATFKFTGISSFLMPLLDFLYPVLIILAIWHTGEYFFSIKTPLRLQK